MNATQKQRKSNTPSRRALMDKVRRDTHSMVMIATLADAASSYAEERYLEHPQSAAMHLTATMNEIYRLLPKEIKCPNRK